MSGRPRFVWVVSDQSKNRNFTLAYVKAIVGRLDVSPAPVVKPCFVELRHLRPRPSDPARDEARTRIDIAIGKAGGRKTDPVLVFRDSETSDATSYRRESQDGHELEERLRAAFPNVHVLVFNPMTEGAYLLFDVALDELRARFPDSSDLDALARDRRAHRFLNRDLLKAVLDLDSAITKSDLDGRMAELIFASWPDCEQEAFVRATQRIERVLRAGLAP